MAEESGRGQRRLAAYSQRWERPPTAAEEAAQWAQLPHLLAERGASEPEAKAVSGALRATAEARTVSGHHLICMPVYVEEGHAGAARVWLIGVAWGLRGTGANGADERLGHVWFVAIDRGSPHAVLAQISCG